MNQRHGMTLVELLVVLAILALMTTVAVTSTDVFMSQGRYEATTKTLTDIQEAVARPAQRPAIGRHRDFHGLCRRCWAVAPVDQCRRLGGPPRRSLDRRAF